MALTSIDNFLEVADYSATSVRTMKNSAGQIGFAPHNLILASEDFSDSNWTKTDTTVTPNAAAAPDGTITADKISHTSGVPGFYQNVTTISGTSVGFGVFLKHIDHQWIRVVIDVGIQVWVDIENGVIGTDSTSGATLTPLSDGWYMVSTGNSSTDTTSSVNFFLADADNSTGKSVGTEAYIWGAHLYENGLAGMFDVPEDQRALASLTKYLPNKAVVTGPNLVSNGTFDSNTNGWTAGNSASLTQSAGEMNVASNGVNYGFAYQTVDTEVGGIYALKSDIDMQSGTSVRLSAGTSAGGNELGHDDETTGFATLYFTATGTTTYINAVNLQALTTGPNFNIDNITVTKVDRDPTAARFLPRRNNHEYIDGAWKQGLLAESEARTNNFTQALDFSDADWTLDGDTVVAAGGAFGMTSFTLTEATATYAGVYQSVTLTAVPWTTWCVAKSGTSDDLRIRYGGSTNRNADFDLSDGSVAAVDGSSTAGTVALGNGYYLCWHTTTPTAGATNTAINCANGAVELVCAQAEAGSTPSSIIPTYGATRTRTAETFTQKEDKIIWPNTTYVDGTELFAETFTVPADWTDNGDGSFTRDGTQAGTTSVVSGSSYSSGSVYELTLNVTGSTQGQWWVYFGGLGFATGGGQQSDLSGNFTFYYHATGAGTGQIQLSGDDLFDGTVTLSVKEINPRALAVVMHGYMTYADNDTQEAEFWRQRVDGDNYVSSFLVSNTGTGEPRFAQGSNGTADYSTGSGAELTAGVNTEFKIAARYLDNAIQGAVSGTAYTANTTPPGLPDLSATQAEWFYDFMGHITFLGVGQESSADKLDSTNGPTTLTTATGGSFLA